MTDPTRQAVSAFATDLARAYRAAQFYPITHPALEKSIQRVHHSLRTVFFGSREVTLTVTKQAVLYQDKPVEVLPALMVDLAYAIFRRRIKELHIQAETTDVELMHLLGLLVDDPNKIAQWGGPEKAFARKAIINIWCNQVRFSRADIADEITEQPDQEQVPDEQAQQDMGPDPLEQLLGAHDAQREVVITVRNLLDETNPDAFARLLEPALREAKVVLDKKGPRSVLPLALALHQISRTRGEPVQSWSQRALRALVRQDVLQELLREMNRALGTSWEVYRDLIGMLGPAVIPYLLSNLASQEGRKERLRVISAIVQYGKAVEDLARTQLGDERWYVVRNALHVLGEIHVAGVPESFERDIAALLNHGHEAVRREAAVTLRKYGTETAFKLLSKALKRAEDADARALLSEIAAFPTQWSEPLVLPYLTRGPLAVRIEAALALSILGSQAAIEAMSKVLTKPKALLDNEGWQVLRKAVGERMLVLLPEAMPAFEAVRHDPAPAIQKLVQQADAIMKRAAARQAQQAT